MGRKAALDEADVQEILSLRDEFGALQKDNASLRSDVSKLQEDMHSIDSKQGDISTHVGSIEKAVLDLSKQLSAISQSLQTLIPPGGQIGGVTNIASSSQTARSPTLHQEDIQEQQLRKEFLRKQLELEKEKTKQLKEIQTQHLPPLKVHRQTFPPGYDNQQRTDHVSAMGTPATARDGGHTPVFNKYYQTNRDRQMWQGYYRNYENDMQAQFMKSMTKGPKLDFTRFEGTDPVGWIRQCDKYFQMSAAPEEYKVSPAQLYVIGEADTWLRRSGTLKK
ncbi:hypothetical protein ZWY2020_055072 [Hordeum vulgare]|nr:hypothetical protein ZWY2020_055072 [Hordeum vulgare]